MLRDWNASGDLTQQQTASDGLSSTNRRGVDGDASLQGPPRRPACAGRANCVYQVGGGAPARCFGSRTPLFLPCIIAESGYFVKGPGGCTVSAVSMDHAACSSAAPGHIACWIDAWANSASRGSSPSF